jgi:DHA2 family methylenomycin A resistance protein-like MFS transporter
VAKTVDSPSTTTSHITDQLGSKAWLLIGISLGYFLVLLDTTIVNVALPAIEHDLGGGLAGLQWVINAYTLVFASLLLGAGVLSDRFGAKRMFLSGLVTFSLVSLLSAFAPSLYLLIALRALLAIGGAFLTPASMALITHNYPDPRQRARATGVWASITVIGMAAGPFVGGILVDTVGWRWIFLINLPIALLSLVLCTRLVSETPSRSHRRFDIAGQLTSILAVATLTYALIEGSQLGWASPMILGAFAAGLVFLVAFVLIEARSASPMLPLRLFQNVTISSLMYFGLVINFVLAGILFLLSLYFQQARGYSAFVSGLAFLPLGIPMILNATLTGRIVGRVGAKIPMMYGSVLFIVGTLLLLLSDAHSNYAITAVSLIIMAFGMTSILPALLATVMSVAPRDLLGTASGAVNSSRQLGGVIGVAVLGALLHESPDFISGFHLSLQIAAVALFSGALLMLVFVREKR